jgi:hypothetical protein
MSPSRAEALDSVAGSVGSSEAERGALVGPGKRQARVFHQLGGREGRRMTAVEDVLDDVGSEEG